MTIDWLGLNIADSDKNVLGENLPPNYDYRIHFFKLDKKVVHDAESQFSAKMSVKLGNCTEDGAKYFWSNSISSLLLHLITEGVTTVQRVLRMRKAPVKSQELFFLVRESAIIV